ncbi:MAG: LPS assembly lipoprotein LptE [Phycisphaerae bacterium]
MTGVGRSSRVIARVILCCSFAAGVVPLWGCSYSTERPFRDDIQSVHVEMFHSRDFRRELEFALTEAIAKRIEVDTPYRLARRERADSVLSGSILEVHQRTLGSDFRTDRPRETGVTFVARWQWKNLQTGEILRDQPRFIYTTTYIPPVGESFDTGVVRGMDGLAERIVAMMEKSW